MPPTIIHDPGLPLAAFLDAPVVAYTCAGAVGGCLLFMALWRLAAVAEKLRRHRPAHLPRRGRTRPEVPAHRAPREARHRVADLTQQMTAYPYPAYLGPPETAPPAPAAPAPAAPAPAAPAPDVRADKSVMPPCSVCGRRTHEQRPALAAAGGAS